MLGLKTMGI